MNKYEIVNQQTGEIEEFETQVNLDLIEAYEEWKLNCRLNPPQYTPREYAEYVSLTNARRNADFALSYIQEFIDNQASMDLDQVIKLDEILRNEK